MDGYCYVAMYEFVLTRLQEVKSQPQNIVMDTFFDDAWTSTFNKILCRQRYVLAKNIRLQGILLLVYTQMKHVTHLRDIEAQYTKTGLGGMWVSNLIIIVSIIDIEFNLDAQLLIISHGDLHNIRKLVND